MAALHTCTIWLKLPSSANAISEYFTTLDMTQNQNQQTNKILEFDLSAYLDIMLHSDSYVQKHYINTLYKMNVINLLKKVTRPR